MSQYAIDAHHLSKRFRIGVEQQRYVTLRDSVTQIAAAPLKSLLRVFEPKRYFWALDDVSFQVPHGEIVGIIGRNGAGKTTLLKVLSRITGPTKGFVDIEGRVGSLLEVGTGFHMELTGRENIYLNGAILGMKKAEIDRRFDEIVAFAEVEKFIDTPAKRYSTGMFLRLAFSVAAHLDTEILLVDEVLAVGDAEFQKKCLSRLSDVAHEGRTVLFVSHNMGLVRALCQKGIVVERGRIAAAGDVATCIEAYYRLIGALSTRPSVTDRDSTFGPVKIHGLGGNRVSQSEAFEVSVNLRIDPRYHGFTLFCRLEDMQGRQICRLREESTNLGWDESADGHHVVSVKFPPLWLIPGLYSVGFAVAFWGESHSEDIETSDKFPLDVDGRSSATSLDWRSSSATLRLQADPVLHPKVIWSIGNGAPTRRQLKPLS